MNEWIKVEDKLPPINHDVLMYYKGTNSCCVGFVYEMLDGMYWGVQLDNNVEDDAISGPDYWMPLPEPPKEDV